MPFSFLIPAIPRILLLVLVYSFFFSPSPSFALDLPHTDANYVGCLSCHDMAAYDQPNLIPVNGHVALNIDDTLYNNVCWSCHYDGGPAAGITTHSSLQTDNGYGDWTVGCWICHNQHTQEQDRKYGTTYGKFIRTRIDLANITGLAKTGIKDIKFIGATGPNSFADGGAAIDGICEVCHTQTVNPVSGAARFQNTENLDNAHYTAENCMACHDHTAGFEAACTDCHGFAPGTLVFNPGTTNSATAGAHTEHVTNQGYNCNACHYQSYGKLPTHNNGDLKVTMGFAPFADGTHQGGSYDGQNTVQYNTTGTTPATTVNNTGIKTCAALYCHGDYIGSGLNASPVWDDSATGDCGTCHGASNTTPPASGTHAKHAGVGLSIAVGGMNTNQKNIACTVCHEGIAGGTGPDSYTVDDKEKHVNTEVDLSFDTADTRITGSETYSIATGSQEPTDGDTGAGHRDYGTCSNLYCHSNVQPDGGVGPPDVYTTPANLKWGTVAGCYGCHAGEIGPPDNSSNAVTRHTQRMTDPATATGSHYKHLGSSAGEGKCELCHNWFYPSNTNMSQCWTCHHSDEGIRTLHVDGKVDVLFNQYAVFPYGVLSAPYDTVANSNAGYDGTPAPGDGYGSCSNVYCHTDGTAIRTGDGSYTNTTPQWGSSATGCKICHGNSTYADWRQGMPDYANGAPKENSHVEHVNQTDIDNCSFCHPDTTLDGLSINKQAAHGSSNYNVRYENDTDFAGGLNTFANRDVKLRYQRSTTTIPQQSSSGSGYCSAITCHGYPDYLVFSQQQDYTPVKSYVYWGEYVGCGECHLREASAGTVGQGDIDSYLYGDGLHGSIDNDQWLYSGHGKTSGTYDVSGNPAANFSGAANCTEWSTNFFDAVKFPFEEEKCDECLYCHADSVSHDNGTNPFRLTNNNALGNGWNDVCLVCHGTGSAGYDPDGAGSMGSMNRTTSGAVDKYHFGTKHGAGNDGGSLCWDCHDPHGDRISGDGNIYMIHKKVTVEKLDEFGTPDTTVFQIGEPVFTDNQTGSDYASVAPTPPPARYTGICNVCHAVPASGGPDHYSWQHGDGHNIGQKCTDCHMHSADTITDGNAFDIHSNANAAVGNCEYCHADPRPDLADWNALAPGDNGNNYGTNVPTQLACKECHISFNDGNMIISKFTRVDYSKYKTDYTKSIQHQIPNPAGRINNYGICFNCHDGTKATAVQVWHARPDKHDPSWSYDNPANGDSQRCTGTRDGDLIPDPPPMPDNWALYAPGRTSGTIGRFNLFMDPGFGYTPNDSLDFDQCSDWQDYTTTPLTFTRIAIPAVPGNGNSSGSVPVFPSLTPQTP